MHLDIIRYCAVSKLGFQKGSVISLAVSIIANEKEEKLILRLSCS
jgi:hypothetical protein